MKLFRKKTHNSLVFVVGANSLSSVFLVTNASKIRVASYQEQRFNAHEIVDGIIINWRVLTDIVTTMMSRIDDNVTHVSCVLEPSLVKEQFVLSSSSSSLRGVNDVQQDVNHATSVEFLYPCEESFVFYVAHVSHILILQLQLLFMRASVDCSVIIPYFFPLLRCYKQFYAHAYRTAQFARDMQYNDNNLFAFFSRDIAHRLINVQQLSPHYSWRTLLVALGSHLLTHD